jgi:hypothetical protein
VHSFGSDSEILTMRKTASLALGLFATFASHGAFAQQAAQEPAKELAPAHCTLTKAVLCKEAGCTASDSFGDLKLPTKVSLDFTKRVLLGVGPDGFATATSVDSFAVAGTELIAYGVDAGASWVAHADTTDQTFTITVSSDHTVLSAFGTCTAAN